jgi:enamine deaminase RidA (YjgF/YER057c/UK114 family)
MSLSRIGVGPRTSKVVLAGGFIHLSGQVAEKAAGASVREQTVEILAKIDDLLAQAGSDKTKIVTVTIWLADIASFAEMNAVWDAWVPAGATPARATVEAKLAGPQYTVEIKATAAA